MSSHHRRLPMKKSIIIPLLSALLIGSILYWHYFGKVAIYHKHLVALEVQSIRIYQDIHTSNISDPKKISTFVNAFNKSTLLKDNDEGIGTTPIWGIRFNLVSGHWIDVSEYGNVLSVQRNDNANRLNRNNYWRVDDASHVGVYYFVSSPNLAQVVKAEFK